MTAGAQSPTIQVSHFAGPADSGTMGNFRAGLGAGTSPDQWVVVPKDIFQQYRRMISELETQLQYHRQYVAHMLARQGYAPVAEGSGSDSLGLDPASAAVVNSLLCSVPETNYYRNDESE